MLHTGNGEPEEQGGNILNLQTILFHRNKDGLSANLLYYYPALRALLLPLSRAWLRAPFRSERSERRNLHQNGRVFGRNTRGLRRCGLLQQARPGLGFSTASADLTLEFRKR